MISVCMATYNGAAYVEEQMASVLGQLGPADEVVVSDDGSADGTVDLIVRLGDPRVRFVEGPPLRSAPYNLERALRAAAGDVVFLCDQDDVWLPGRVDRAVDLHAEHDVVVVDSCLIDSEGRVLVPSVFGQWGGGPGFLKNLYRNRYIGCCTSVSRRLLSLALPFPPSIPMHDSWIGLLGEATGSTCFHRETLVLYRQHEGNASPAGRPSPYSRAEQAAQRLRLLADVAARVAGRWEWPSLPGRS